MHFQDFHLYTIFDYDKVPRIAIQRLFIIRMIIDVSIIYSKHLIETIFHSTSTRLWKYKQNDASYKQWMQSRLQDKQKYQCVIQISVPALYHVEAK